LHSDHCGGNATLKRHWPLAQTLIPPGLAHAVALWDEVALTYEPTGQRCEPFGFDALLEPGSTLNLVGTTWQVHAAPGHDTHSVVLFHPESRTLLSADALWGNGFGVVFPALDGTDAFAEVGQTLDLIEKLNPLKVIPGHGAPFTDVTDALARARGRLAHWQAHPHKHAEHGLKVLLKYKMLEMLRYPLVDLQHWMLNTPYFRRVHAAYSGPAKADGSNGYEAWANKALQSLLQSGALRQDGDWVLDGA
jgi:glyoxylase-like metal-dependent hydrolase (beta-lactamase superfamily II)